jgi:hypothetical protein
MSRKLVLEQDVQDLSSVGELLGVKPDEYVIDILSKSFRISRRVKLKKLCWRNVQTLGEGQDQVKRGLSLPTFNPPKVFYFNVYLLCDLPDLQFSRLPHRTD